MPIPGSKMNEVAAALRNPFAPEDIEWRMQQSGSKNGKPWGLCLAYVNNRAVMDRFDQVCGIFNWREEYIYRHELVECGIFLNVDGVWIGKWDASDPTDIEAVKGAFSGAEKRAAVKWGVGRYLYSLETKFCTFNQGGRYSAKIDGQYYRWDPPALPPRALPGG